MKNTLQISVYEKVGETLNSRDSATNLFHLVLLSESSNVVFDFSKVEFMSRSFADQFHKERMNLKEKNGLFIQIMNATDSIRKILLTVELTQNKKNRFYTDIPFFMFTEDKMEDYIFAL